MPQKKISFAAISSEAGSAHAERLAAFEENARGHHRGLCAAGFARALRTTRPSVTDTQIEALWTSFSGGASGASMGLKTFEKFAIEVAQGDRAASELADANAEALRVLHLEQGVDDSLVGLEDFINSGSSERQLGPSEPHEPTVAACF